MCNRSVACDPPRPCPPRLGGDGGAVMVETALVMPMVFGFLFALIDLGFAAFQTTQAANAARDGSRRAILWPEDPTNAQSTAMQAKVKIAVKAHLDDKDIVADADIKIYCLKGETETKIDCGKGEPGVDRVRTEVPWTYTPLTFVGTSMGLKKITGTSTMYLVGQPMGNLASSPTSMTTGPTTTTTTGPTTSTEPDPSTTTVLTTTTLAPTTTTTVPATTSTLAPVTTVARCTADVDFEPNNGKLAGNGNLNKNVAVTITINGSGDCAGPSLKYWVDAGAGATQAFTVTMSPTGTPRRYTAVIPQDAPNGMAWEEGAHKVAVMIGGSPVPTTPANLNVT